MILFDEILILSSSIATTTINSSQSIRRTVIDLNFTIPLHVDSQSILIFIVRTDCRRNIRIALLDNNSELKLSFSLFLSFLRIVERNIEIEIHISIYDES